MINRRTKISITFGTLALSVLVSWLPNPVEAQAPPTGIERAPSIQNSSTTSTRTGAWKISVPKLQDGTDRQPELVQESEWLLSARAPELKASGNIFAVENALDGAGRVFLCLAPLPGARAIASDWDFKVKSDGTVLLNEKNGYPWVQTTYSGGRWGRIAAAHSLQRAIRPCDPKVHGLLMTNTWGDRARDAHLNSKFLAQEVLAAKALSVDVLEIDDGWQKGVSSNSTVKGGVWGGFWASDPNYWDVNPTRFPEDLDAIATLAHKEGIKLGLWFAPDSSKEAANWQRDANALLRLHRDLGVDFFKIDGLKISTAKSEENYRQLFATVRKGSKEPVSFDFDVTAERRFGYFGMMDGIFVENRYTDWGSYLPHQTLRAAWTLAQWVDPVRLRMEWLNNARNTGAYRNNPLAPACYRPDTLFAITMFCSPLGWFEVQNLPSQYFTQAAPLIAKWKQHREALFGGDILPVGEVPDGVAWTGFVSIQKDRQAGYALLFRELNSLPTYQLQIPLWQAPGTKVEVLGGAGKATLEQGALSVSIPDSLGFLWVQFSSVANSPMRLCH